MIKSEGEHAIRPLRRSPYLRQGQTAQEIYEAAYDSAWDQYADEADRRGEAAREETARRVAWSAVNNKYEKRGDEWVRKSEQGHLNR